METKSKRIWELDCFRGFLIICVVIVHGIFFYTSFYTGVPLKNPVYYVIKQYGGSLFVLLSGICITLGHHPVKRGVQLLCIALIITLLTWMLFPDMAIVFGVLHLLAVCMLTYPLYRKAPPWLTLMMAVSFIVIGFLITDQKFSFTYLVALGFQYKGFQTFDYFPVFPQAGYFLIGVFLGSTLYKRQSSLFPLSAKKHHVVNLFSWLGRKSLYVYLIHPPLFFGICYLLKYIKPIG